MKILKETQLCSRHLAYLHELNFYLYRRRRWPLCLPLPLISFAVVVGVVRVATSFGRGREFTMTDVAGAAELMPN